MTMPQTRIALLFILTTAGVSPGFSADRAHPVMRSEFIHSTTTVTLAYPGVDGLIPYQKLGRFEDRNSSTYKYTMRDKKGLAKAAGEGIFPNKDVSRDPRFQELLKNGKLKGNHWTYVDSRDLEANFYKWASTNEDPGVKQFYTALVFERLGMIEEAIKAYYALLVHFPKTVSYTYYNTPWYLGPSTIDRIVHLIRRHPELKWDYKVGRVTVVNKFDNDPKNDSFIIDPGQLVQLKKPRVEKVTDVSRLRVIKHIGGVTRPGEAGPRVELKQYSNRHWQLFVRGKPFPIKGIDYSVTPIGASPDRRTWNVSKDWQLLDTNKNGTHDGFFESYVDKNGNNKRDDDEPVVGDAQLMKDMGVNTLRAYHHLYNKELFRKIYNEYGFYIMCGDLMGAYAVGSGATWDKGTDYRDPSQRKQMLDGVREMVEEYKDEPYILMWVLGNENVFADHANNSGKYPEEFYELINEAAQMIHKIDPSHPVAICNGDLQFLNVFKKKCPDVDVFGTNVYRGEHGFGYHVFKDVQDLVDLPVVITEYGASSIAEGYTTAEAEEYQAMYLENNWEDLEANMAGRGVGNALGGVIFEWMDEWWKANADLPESVQLSHAAWYEPRSKIYKDLQPEHHDEVPQFGFPFLDGWSYEEWYGLVAQGSGKDSPFSRQLRPAYYRMKEIWNKK